MEESRRFGFDTRQVHAGQRPDRPHEERGGGTREIRHDAAQGNPERPPSIESSTTPRENRSTSGHAAQGGRLAVAERDRRRRHSGCGHQ